MTELAIISVFYNRASSVKDSVKSLIDSAPQDSVIILVNDGSTDSTLDELLKFDSFENVEILDKKNSGFTKCLTYTIDEIIERHSPKYLAIHGAGDIAHEEKFLTQIKFMNENSKVVAVGCGHLLKSAINPGESRGHLAGYFNANLDALKKTVPFTHGTVVYRTDAYISSGGYNCALNCCQDWDLYFRLIKIGSIVRIPNIMYSKFIFEDGVSFSPSKKVEQIKFKRILLAAYSNEPPCELNEKNIEAIHSTISETTLIRDYKLQQLSLIKKREYQLARSWKKFIAINFLGRVDQVLKIALISFLEKIRSNKI